MNLLAAASSGPSPLWYLTRGSGVVSLVLLTLSICLGIATSSRAGGRTIPRFAFVDLHRSVSLFAVVFLGFHVATSVFDAYAHIRWLDAVVPFAGTYRSFWLGLGALSFDLLAAVIVTSLMRARLGYARWKAVHWLAYASWPVALLHSFGTGSDARTPWLQAIAVVSIALVGWTLTLRVAQSTLARSEQLLMGAAAAVAVLGLVTWYQTGPGAKGWAARAGTPKSLLAAKVTSAPKTAAIPVALRSGYSSPIHGTVTESQSDNGDFTVRLDGYLTGTPKARLRLVLQGPAADGGGVTMTSSGADFAVQGVSGAYSGSIISLSGTTLDVNVQNTAGKTLDLQLTLTINPSQTAFTGTVAVVPV